MNEQHIKDKAKESILLHENGLSGFLCEYTVGKFIKQIIKDKGKADKEALKDKGGIILRDVGKEKEFVDVLFGEVDGLIEKAELK